MCVGGKGQWFHQDNAVSSENPGGGLGTSQDFSGPLSHLGRRFIPVRPTSDGCFRDVDRLEALRVAARHAFAARSLQNFEDNPQQVDLPNLSIKPFRRTCRFIGGAPSSSEKMTLVSTRTTLLFLLFCGLWVVS